MEIDFRSSRWTHYARSRCCVLHAIQVRQTSSPAAISLSMWLFRLITSARIGDAGIPPPPSLDTSKRQAHSRVGRQVVAGHPRILKHRLLHALRGLLETIPLLARRCSVFVLFFDFFSGPKNPSGDPTPCNAAKSRWLRFLLTHAGSKTKLESATVQALLGAPLPYPLTRKPSMFKAVYTLKASYGQNNSLTQIRRTTRIKAKHRLSVHWCCHQYPLSHNGSAQELVGRLQSHFHDCWKEQKTTTLVAIRKSG